MKQEMTGAEIVLQSLVDQGVEVVFGYPGVQCYLSMIPCLNKTQSSMFGSTRRWGNHALKVMHAQQVKLE